MEILRAKLYEIKREREMNQLSQERQSQIGTADRSEKIRTYNYPQNRVTDHRINKSWHDLETIMNGKLDAIVKTFRKTET
ncbi:MAG: Peptide chain release factor 1 [Parcubacteria group bacterium GW2011_GWF1_45_5]|nr:MAG: Peptide chain release factor 1 [Parcubacteria group bacterium GW2011_GWF1_45_5]